jgi:GNAT superfamily N-acetyltransferase
MLTSPVNYGETKIWIKKDDIEVWGLAENGVLEGVVILRLAAGGEVTFFARRKNKGIGTLLLEIIRKVAADRGLESVWAWTMEANIPAQKAFEKGGYQRVGVETREHQGRLLTGVRYIKNVGANGMRK